VLTARATVASGCRNNAIVPAAMRSSGSGGLAFATAPTGTLIAYATAPGGTAADGSGRLSPYTAAFVEELKVPGRPVEETFKAVRRRVRRKTGGVQVTAALLGGGALASGLSTLAGSAAGTVASFGCIAMGFGALLLIPAALLFLAAGCCGVATAHAWLQHHTVAEQMKTEGLPPPPSSAMAY
jgi:hypothetical protein